MCFREENLALESSNKPALKPTDLQPIRVTLPPDDVVNVKNPATQLDANISVDSTTISETNMVTVSEGEWILRSDGQLSPACKFSAKPASMPASVRMCGINQTTCLTVDGDGTLTDLSSSDSDPSLPADKRRTPAGTSQLDDCRSEGEIL